MMMRDVSADRPLKKGDALRLRGKTPDGHMWLNRHGNIWIIQRIHTEVWCLMNQPGILMAPSRALDQIRWVVFPEDPNLVIVERLPN